MYAFFASNAYSLIGRYNAAQYELKQWDDKQYALATTKSNLQNELSADRMRASSKLAKLYEEYGEIDSDNEQALKDKKSEIDSFQQKQTQLEEQGNMKINALAPIENLYEIMKKAAETKATKIGKEMETNDKAIANGIEKANPNYTGIQA